MALGSGHQKEGASGENSAETVAPSARLREQDAADARCVLAVLKGERHRFEELVKRHQNAVLAVVLGLVRDPHLAEDYAQEVFLKAYTGLDKLRDPQLFFPWLIGIARNHALSVRRKRRAVEIGLSDTPAPEPENQEEWLKVLATVEQMDEPYRTTILLRYQQGLDCREIASRERVAVATVTSRLSRGISLLRRILKENS